MSMTTVAYARRAYKFFSRSARHIYQLIASHQDLYTGWAYLSYTCLAEESSLTPRRIMQLVAFLEEKHAIEVRRGHGRGHTNFYRILDEQTGQPVPHRSAKKVKLAGESGREKVKFPTPPAAENAKSETLNPLQSLRNVLRKEVDTKDKEEGKGVHVCEDQTTMATPTTGEAPPNVETSTTEKNRASGSIPIEPLAADWHSSTLQGRAREMFDMYQTICEPAGLQHETYTPDLEHDIITGLRKYGDYVLWQQALSIMAMEPYFTSTKARGWEDSLHWLVTKDHAYRVINGHYAKAPRRPASTLAPKKCGIDGCDAPACPHWQLCAKHACCEICNRPDSARERTGGPPHDPTRP